ncbi:MAG: alpha/beta fold hydrolase [Usitatibacteraceae bacterium]
MSTQQTPIAPEYDSPWWLGRGAFGAHLQTVYPALFDRAPALAYKRERWDSTPFGKPDGDFIDVDRLDGARGKPMLVVFHGLEGSSQRPYALNLMAEARRRGWRGLVPHFRGCSGEINRLPRAYHSGDAAEIDWILRRAKAEAPEQPLFAAAISLGGNATLKWLGEQGSLAASVVEAAAAISAPVDLAAAGGALEQGFCKVYTKNFLATMKKKSLTKLDLHPGIFRAEIALKARTLREFDNEVTAPLHGYRDTDDYWTRASAKPGLIDVRVPTLVLNALNDPFLPASALPSAREVSPDVTLHFPHSGGHVGFASGSFPGRGTWMPKRVFHFFDHRI